MIDKLSSGVNLYRLLAARPRLADLLALILAHAPPLADQLGRRPTLLDGLIDESSFASPPDAKELANILRFTTHTPAPRGGFRGGRGGGQRGGSQGRGDGGQGRGDGGNRDGNREGRSFRGGYNNANNANNNVNPPNATANNPVAAPADVLVPVSINDLLCEGIYFSFFPFFCFFLFVN